VTLADILRDDRVVIPLEAETLADAARMLIERLAAAGVVTDLERLQSRVDEEQGEDIVALGGRAFLAHYRTDAVNELAVAVGISPRPVTRSIGDGEEQEARIVIVILAPPRAAARYLQVVGAFAQLLNQVDSVEALLAAPSAEALVELPGLRATELPAQLVVRDIMTDRPRTTTADTPIRDAARIMVRAHYGALPVVDERGLLIGMLSERELMRHMVAQKYMGAGPSRPAGSGTTRTVRDVMTRQVLCVSPEQPLAEAASLMANKDVDRVPVVAEGRVIGLLTRGDIVRKLIGS
jgi:CBS domain-containing protein/mannitol/fructose-specific phosphotransferase system IIA component (Ntr-type)